MKKKVYLVNVELVYSDGEGLSLVFKKPPTMFMITQEIIKTTGQNFYSDEWVITGYDEVDGE
jgi:hypothetical protein